VQAELMREQGRHGHHRTVVPRTTKTLALPVAVVAMGAGLGTRPSGPPLLPPPRRRADAPGRRLPAGPAPLPPRAPGGQAREHLPRRPRGLATPRARQRPRCRDAGPPACPAVV